MLLCVFFFLMIRRPPRSTLDRSSAASDVYKRQVYGGPGGTDVTNSFSAYLDRFFISQNGIIYFVVDLSLIHISEPTRPY